MQVRLVKHTAAAEVPQPAPAKPSYPLIEQAMRRVLAEVRQALAEVRQAREAQAARELANLRKL